MSQSDMILAHLQAGESITPMEALKEYGIFRLAARIRDIREAGHDVQTVMEGEGDKKWARYSLRRAVPAYAADGQGLLAL